jgi:hypothetical protein
VAHAIAASGATSPLQPLLAFPRNYCGDQTLTILRAEAEVGDDMDRNERQNHQIEDATV